MVDEVFKKYLENRFSGPPTDFYERKIGRYHASDTGKCLRQLYYKYMGVASEKTSSWPHFLLGNNIEKMYEWALKFYYGHDFIKNSIRIQLDFDDISIVGQTDPVLLAPNLDIKKIFEIKSTSSISSKKKYGVSKHHVYQVHPYMSALKCPCEIVYIHKLNLETAKFDIDFDPDILTRGVNRVRSLHEYLVKGALPPAEPFMDWNCKPGFCPFKDICAADKNIVRDE